MASKLGVPAGSLEAKNGRIASKTDGDKSLSWKEACSLLGMNALEVTGKGSRAATLNFPAPASAACKWPRSKSTARPAS